MVASFQTWGEGAGDDPSGILLNILLNIVNLLD